jgi:alkylhydroperoxidase family enzyme
MARVDLLPQDASDPEIAAMFAEVRARGVEVPDLYRVIGHAPPVLRGWLDFAWPLRLDATVPRALRELLILRIAQRSGVLYEWSHHVPMALAAGLGRDKVDAVADGPASPLFDETERTLLALADEVVDGPGASEATVARLRERFGQKGTVEVVMTACFYVCVGRFLGSMGIEPEAGHAVTPLPR